MKKSQPGAGQNLPVSLSSEEATEVAASGERLPGPGAVVATDDAEASRDAEEQALDVLQEDALEVDNVEEDADIVAAERPTGAFGHNDDELVTQETLPPVYDCEGQQVGTVFPTRVIETTVRHLICDDNIQMGWVLRWP